jgi:hypothetical protein
MTALEKAAELQEEAVNILLAEREQIDARLGQLGYGQEKAALGKKRGRPSKTLTSDLLGMTGSVEPSEI